MGEASFFRKKEQMIQNFYQHLIKIKFLGPTNYKGSRYKATVKDGDSFQFSATVPSTYASDNSDVIAAAEAVAENIRLDMNSRNSFKYEIKAYDVEIVGSYDGDHYATMTPVIKTSSGYLINE